MTPVECYHQLLALKLIKEFEKRNIEGYYCPLKEDALNKLLEIIPEGATVSNGGSLTLKEIGAISALHNGNYQFLDPNAVADIKEKDRIAHAALGADYYLMSANAIALTGELVNADGYGNRVAALIFGPKHVIVVAGMNKVEPDLNAAIKRVKTQAAQKCLTLFRQDYASFEALEEVSQKAIGQTVITSMSTMKGRIKVILVGESLGM
jgi:hypothetical protein